MKMSTGERDAVEMRNGSPLGSLLEDCAVLMALRRVFHCTGKRKPNLAQPQAAVQEWTLK